MAALDTVEVEVEAMVVAEEVAVEAGEEAVVVEEEEEVEGASEWLKCYVNASIVNMWSMKN